MKQPQRHRVADKGQVSIDFPEKFYVGSFGEGAKFEAEAENDGLMIKLHAHGEKREAQIHLHHHLLADILEEWANSLKHQPKMSKDHKERLAHALKQIEKAL